MEFEEAMAQRFKVQKDDVKRLWKRERQRVKPASRPRPGQGAFGDVVDGVMSTLKKDTGRE